MRGTRGVMVLTLGTEGIIPAYAGNTAQDGAGLGHAGDHPRVCGEHRRLVFGEIVELGSSPRMRGTQGAVRNTGQRGGIIPAYAGNT